MRLPGGVGDGNLSAMTHPAPTSPEELAAFADLQQQLPALFRTISADDRRAHTVVVIPSLSMDRAELAKITGVHHYEERLLFMLMLLRLPRTRMIFVTSEPVPPDVVDYYLHLLSGVPTSHARRRLTLLSCHDASPLPLTQKILARPRLLNRILGGIRTESAHLACFNSTALERTLAVRSGATALRQRPGALGSGHQERLSRDLQGGRRGSGRWLRSGCAAWRRSWARSAP